MTTFDFSGLDASLVSGLPIWKTEKVIGTGKTANTADAALKQGFKAEQLGAGTINYLVDQFGKLRMVARLNANDKSLAFISPLHDKNGNPIIAGNDTYELRQVVCVRDFAVPNSDKVIKVGDRMLKAYVA